MRYDKDGHPIIDNLDQVDSHIADRSKALKKDKLYMFKDGMLHIDHMAAADALIKFINSTPRLDKHIKEIMIMRIGSPAMDGVKMSHTAIALAKGMDEREVVFLEQVGVKIVNEYLERITLLDGALSNPSNSRPNEILDKVSKIKQR